MSIDGSNHRGSNEELVVAEIGQVGTQFQDPMLVGSDNSAIEVSPNPDPQLAGPVHQIMLVVNGIHLLENMKLDEIAARRLYEFALILEPLKIQGATGSTVAPIAIH